MYVFFTKEISMPNIDERIVALKESLNPRINPILPSRGVPGDKASLTTWTELTIYPDGATKNGRVVSGNGQSGGTWILPLPTDLSEPHSLQYEPIEFGAIARGAVNAVRAMKGSSDMTEMEKRIMSLDAEAIKNVLGDVAMSLGEEVLGFVGNEQMVNIARGVFRNTANPNMENMFKTANLRTFQFSWNLTPLSSQDAAKIKEFISKMRETIYPVNNEILFGWNRLKFPSEFTVSFYASGLQGQRIIFKTAPCVCTDFVIQYTPNGAYNTHIDGEPTSVSINATFQEMYSLHQGDIIGLEK
jgi:hypothetical protein